MENTVCYDSYSLITRIDLEKSNGHQSVVTWFTGLSGSGKSTIAHEVEKRLFSLGCRTFVFDGDNERHGLCGDLGFTPKTERKIPDILARGNTLLARSGEKSYGQFYRWSPSRIRLCADDGIAHTQPG
ncbi:MAG: adenylyl-sulfate kinase [Proteobacteria bacterium]|nr:adenylyl-sulfate kinase [Pseudomonadota bacterium]